MKRTFHTLLAVIGLLSILPDSASAAVKLQDLTSPSVQTLLDLGSAGVVVGQVRYFDFGYVPLSAGSPSASVVGVQPLAFNGLRFVTGFSAINGQYIGAVLSYSMETTDPLYQITTLDLFTDGTALVSGPGTFAIATQTVRSMDGLVLGHILSTFGDGSGGLVDHNYDSTPITASNAIKIMQSLAVKADLTSAGGGFASLSVVEARSVVIPEPAAGLLLLGALGVAGLRRPIYK